MAMRMQSRTHTPGPWTTQNVESEHNLVYVLIRAGDDGLAFAGVYEGHDAEANAALIAAAPDLLDAASAALRVIDDTHPVYYWLRAVIAEAQGQGTP